MSECKCGSQNKNTELKELLKKYKNVKYLSDVNCKP